jgi:diadenosine tetraphosphate (Ap4A) HIT family hydrolase
MTGFRCEVCGFGVAQPLKKLRVAWLGCFDDARFPGRGVLVLERHAEHFSDLDEATATALALDVREAARAIRAATGAVRINYAMLGNVEPHVHVHVIPRRADDPIPMRTPWEHPELETPLSPEAADQWKRAILEELLQARPSAR